MLSALPNVAPIKNSGVTSPPLNPDCMVITVNTIFRMNNCKGAASLKLLMMDGMPRPARLLYALKNRKPATMVPPSTTRMYSLVSHF